MSSSNKKAYSRIYSTILSRTDEPYIKGEMNEEREKNGRKKGDEKI